MTRSSTVIQVSELSPETVARAPYPILEDDRGIRFAQGEALSLDRWPDPAVVVKIGSVVRVHYGTASVKTVLEREYGFSF